MAAQDGWRAGASDAENRMLGLTAGAAILFGMVAAVVMSYIPAIEPPNNPDVWRVSLALLATGAGAICLAAPRWVATHRLTVYAFIGLVGVIAAVCMHVTPASWLALLMAAGLVTWVAFFLTRAELVVTLTGMTMVILSALTWPPPGQASGFNEAQLLVMLPVLWLLGIDLNNQCATIRDARRMIKYRALSDPLTGLGNLRLLRQAVESEVGAGNEFGIVTLDLDGFNRINERRGQAGGDAALRLVGERLQATVGRRALVCRPTGDDFAVIIPGATACTIDETRDLLVKAVQSANSQPTADRALIGDFELSAAAGWATHPKDGGTLAALLASAERRLVAARSGERISGTPAHGERRDGTPKLVAVGRPTEPEPKRRRRLAARSERTWINLVGWSGGWMGMLLALTLIPMSTEEAVGSATICLAALAFAGYRFFRSSVVDAAPTRGAVRYAADLLIAALIATLAWLTGGFESPALILAAALVVRANFVNSRQSSLWRWVYPLATLWSPLLYSNLFASPINEYAVMYVGALSWIVLLATGVNELNVMRSRAARRKALEFQREDPLTGLINRSRFNQLIDGLLATGGAEFAVVTVEIDRHGTAAGEIANDELMARAAAEVVRVTRAGDDVARTGRSEFSVIARDVGAAAAAEIADVYRDAVRQVADSPCAGFAVCEAGSTREELFREASKALATQKPRSNPSLLAI